MIEIQKMTAKKESDIINLLLDEQQQPFKIYIPKSTALFSSTSSDIANDYAMLAFAGQKLSEVADSFDYHYVSPVNHESVLFEVETKNFNLLAKVLLYISHGYNDESTEEVFYNDAVYDFIDKVNKGEVSSVCPDFIDDYLEYYQENNEED
jgi:hypothetical protein